MQTLKDSGYRGWPYIHSDYDRSAITLVWWARTPTGRQSHYLHHATFYRLKSSGKLKRHESGFFYPVYVPSRHYGLEVDELKAIATAKFPPPKLRRGYEWMGPFLYASFNEAPGPGCEWGRFVAMEAPKESDGIPLGYVATVKPQSIDLHLAVGAADHRVNAEP